MNLEKPKFDEMLWDCHACGSKRIARHFKVKTFDISNLFYHTPGIVFINCRYCADNEDCNKKTADKNFVLSKLIPDYLEIFNGQES